MGNCWLPDDALAFDPALLDATPVDDHTVDIGLAAGVTLDDALRALAAPAMRPVPPRLVETHGRTWTTPGRLVTSGGLRLVELHGDKAQDLAVVLAPWRPGTSGIERIELYDYARATTALHLYRSGFLHAILDGGLPEDVRPALAVSRDFVPGARGGALLAPEVQGLRGDGLRLRDVRLAREATP